MPSPNWNDDDELMRDIRRALRPVAVPAEILAAAQAAYAWHTADPDLELATLLYDSEFDQASLVRGPSPSAPRTLVFGRSDMRVEVELSDSGIQGQLIPPGPGTARLITMDGHATETTADEVGCFAFPAQQRGPVKLECAGSAGRFTTEWFTT